MIEYSYKNNKEGIWHKLDMRHNYEILIMYNDMYCYKIDNKIYCENCREFKQAFDEARLIEILST